MDRNKFCYYPFQQLLLQPTGNVSPCCYNQDIVLGNVRDQSLEAIWNGPRLGALRREFLRGQPVSCAKQMDHIGCHRYSEREYLPVTELAEVMAVGPRRLDVRLNGRCNLKCIMCEVWTQPNGIYDDQNFWNWGREKIFPWLREIDVLGGEPFIQADTYRLIAEISSVNPECDWAFTTNGHFNFKAVERFLDRVPIRWIQLSLDSVRSDTFAKIRVGGNLERAMATLSHLQEYQEVRTGRGQSFRLTVSMCVQRANWDEIDLFLNFCAGQNVTPILQFAFIPEETSLLTLPIKERELIVNSLAPLKLKWPEEILQPILSPLLASVCSAEANGRVQDLPPLAENIGGASS